MSKTDTPCLDEQERARIQQLEKNPFMRFLLRLANKGKLLLVAITVNFVVFPVLFWLFEEFGWIDTAYWSVVTGFTVGYGDISPQTNEGKFLTMVHIPVTWLLLALGTVHIIIKLIRQDDRFSHQEQEELKTKVTLILAIIKLILRIVIRHFNLDPKQVMTELDEIHEEIKKEWDAKANQAA